MFYLLIFHICISIFLAIPVFLYYKIPDLTKKHFKNHLLIFIIKILFISMFIYFFINNFKGSDFNLFIITGYINLAIFHIIEGFMVQKIIFKKHG